MTRWLMHMCDSFIRLLWVCHLFVWRDFLTQKVKKSQIWMCECGAHIWMCAIRKICHLYVWRDFLTFLTFWVNNHVCDFMWMWNIDMNVCLKRMSFICVAWLVDFSYVWLIHMWLIHISFVCVFICDSFMWRIDVCDCDASMRVTYWYNVSICVWRDSLTHSYVWLVHMWLIYMSFICVFICDSFILTHSCVWLVDIMSHDTCSLTRGLIHMFDSFICLTHSCVTHAYFIYLCIHMWPIHIDAFMCVSRWYDVPLYVWCASLLCVTRITFTCVWQDLFVPVCDVTQSYVCDDSFVCVWHDSSLSSACDSTLFHVYVPSLLHTCVTRLIHTWVKLILMRVTLCVTWLIHMCVPWLIDICTPWLIHVCAPEGTPNSDSGFVRILGGGLMCKLNRHLVN